MSQDPTVQSGVLTAINGVRAGRLFHVFPSTVIGRSPDCDIRIDDPTVSRRHARIERDGGRGNVLYDLGSRNGTKVRGLPVAHRRLADGDEIGIGPAIFRFGLPEGMGSPISEREEASKFPDSNPSRTSARDDFHERLVDELARAKRNETDVWLFLLDVDPLDSTHEGRMPAGALLRQRLATTFEGALRADDLVADYGHPTFVILAKERKRRDPLLLAERIRRLVERAPVRGRFRGHLVHGQRRRCDIVRLPAAQRGSAAQPGGCGAPRGAYRRAKLLPAVRRLTWPAGRFGRQGQPSSVSFYAMVWAGGSR